MLPTSFAASDDTVNLDGAGEGKLSSEAAMDFAIIACAASIPFGLLSLNAAVRVNPLHTHTLTHTPLL